MCHDAGQAHAAFVQDICNFKQCGLLRLDARAVSVAVDLDQHFKYLRVLTAKRNDGRS